ncbi:MAG: dienelactone hydrolase family protein [Opitutae bacterium]|nr:dienelactone hydrolase family protein [Opitutae bacterium]
MKSLLRFLLLGLVAFTLARATEAPVRREWVVGGVTREALVYAPARAKTELTPVVFVFHGHGGSMQNVVRSFALHTLWPEAIVVYPQGLATPGQLTDPEGKKAGWQSTVGAQDDRDLKFFDAMLAGLGADFRVDPKRLYATGHSNGGGFTYLLWATRGKKFAAFAPSAAVAARQLAQLRPKPVLHLAGENDTLVKFSWQQMTIEALRKLNQCGAGEPWEKAGTLYPSKLGAPVVTFIHPGGHMFPAAGPALIVKFFQQHALP